MLAVVFVIGDERTNYLLSVTPWASRDHVRAISMRAMHVLEIGLLADRTELAGRVLRHGVLLSRSLAKVSAVVRSRVRRNINDNFYQHLPKD